MDKKEGRGIARKIKNLQINIKENTEVIELKEKISFLENELIEAQKDIVDIKKVVPDLDIKR